MASTSARIRLLLNDARMATLSNDSWADRKNHIRTVRIRTLAGASTLALSSRVRAISEDYLGRPSDSDPHHEHPASAGSALEAERLCRRPGHRCTNAHIEASGHIFKGRAMANVPFKRLYGDSVRDVECRRSMTSGTPPPARDQRQPNNISLGLLSWSRVEPQLTQGEGILRILYAWLSWPACLAALCA